MTGDGTVYVLWRFGMQKDKNRRVLIWEGLGHLKSPRTVVATGRREGWRFKAGLASAWACFSTSDIHAGTTIMSTCPDPTPVSVGIPCLYSVCDLFTMPRINCLLVWPVILLALTVRKIRQKEVK